MILRSIAVIGLIIVGSAGCASVVPTPTAVATPPPATESSAPSSSGAVIIDTFLRDFADAQPPFHVDAQVIVTGSSNATITLQMGASGDDYRGTVHSDIDGSISDAEIIVVDGIGYGRTPGADWEVIPSHRQTQPINPFDRLAAAEIDYIGPVDRAGVMLHQLRTTEWIGEDVDTLELDPIVDPTLADPIFDIFVDREGVPHEARLRFSITGTSASQAVRVDYQVNYAFSDIGVPVIIEPPRVAVPSPSPPLQTTTPTP